LLNQVREKLSNKEAELTIIKEEQLAQEQNNSDEVQELKKKLSDKMDELT